VLNVHTKSFQQVVPQAVLLYGILEKNEMDPDKDVLDGCLVPIEEIPLSLLLKTLSLSRTWRRRLKPRSSQGIYETLLFYMWQLFLIVEVVAIRGTTLLFFL